MKAIKRTAAMLLVLSLLLSSLFTSSFALDAHTMWNTYWSDNSDEVSAAITLAPGSNESERCLSWYTSEKENNKVEVWALADPANSLKSFTAQLISTPQGDYRACVTISQLEAGTNYCYKITRGSKEFGPYFFSTLDDNSFNAVYVTDVHMAIDESDPTVIRDKAYKFNEVLALATAKTGGLDLVLSAGDQASYGLRSEYAAFASSPLLKGASLATAIGNHDRKNIDYKFFAFQPNRADMRVSSYVGGDYWFVKGNALFLVMDSNNASMNDHYRFVKQAVEANPDVKWRVAMFHHDLYGGRIEHRESENQLLRTIWAPIADEFGIDLCLLGHSHYYTISNVVYNNKTVTSTKDINSVTDAKGTIFMVSGSINNPRTPDESETLPLGENAGQSYLTGEMIYNLLSFTDESITIKSYTVESNNLFNTFTISKTSNAGGHNYKTPTAFYAPFIRAIGTIYAVFNNIGMYSDYKDLGLPVSFLEGIFG